MNSNKLEQKIVELQEIIRKGDYVEDLTKPLKERIFELQETISRQGETINRQGDYIESLRNLSVGPLKETIIELNQHIIDSFVACELKLITKADLITELKEEESIKIIRFYSNLTLKNSRKFVNKLNCPRGIFVPINNEYDEPIPFSISSIREMVKKLNELNTGLEFIPRIEL